MLRKKTLGSIRFGWIQAGLVLALIATAWPVTARGATTGLGPQGDLSLTIDWFDDWGSGACGDGTVTNHGRFKRGWEIDVDLGGTVTSYWNSIIRESEQPNLWHVEGLRWNRKLRRRASRVFGFCIERMPELETPVEEGLAEDETGQQDSVESENQGTDGEVPMDDDEGHTDGSHEGHADGSEGGSHDSMAPPTSSGDFTDITSWGTFHGSNHNSEQGELVGGRTAITTEAHLAYNNLRAFLGMPGVTIEEVGAWAFSESLTNNSQAWGNDLQGVGLWYAMQGAKVGWISDDAYDPQILADIQRTARTVEDAAEMKTAVMAMVRQYGHAGYAEYLEQYGIVDTFINTLKMEPHYGGWMHGRTHGFRSIEGVAINHDVNHLTVLSWDQMQPFMNDTFDWPQWDALNVSDSGVIEYFQSMVSLGNPVGQNLETAPVPIAPPATDNSVGSPVDQPALPDSASEPDPTDPTLTGLSVEVGGERWWGGFTVELIVRNETGTDLDSWSFRFTSSHRVTGDPWGVAVETRDLGNGFYEYRVSGTDWGQSIPRNGFVTVGFNANQGETIGNSGPLDAGQLFDGGFVGD